MALRTEGQRSSRARKAPLQCEPVADKLTLFDAAAAWDALSEGARRVIGQAAIVASIGSIGRAGGMGQPYEIAEYIGLSMLVPAVGVGLGLVPGKILPPPNLATLGVRACHACGCCDEYACPEGCVWVAPNLCSSCQRGAS